MNPNRLKIVVILNLCIVIGEIIFGVIAKSMGLIADAFHNFSDVIALIIGYIALILSRREVSRQMTYGYVRMEMMAGFINSFLLVIAMIYVIGESVRKLLNPPEVEGIYMIAVAGIAFIANLLSVIILKGHGHAHHHHDHSHVHHHEHEHNHDHEHKTANTEAVSIEPESENMNIKAVTLHLISDVAISLGVIIGGIVIHFTGFGMVDPILSIAFALFILFQAFRIGKKSFLSLIDRHEEDIERFAELINSYPEVKSVHGIHITVPSSDEKFFSAHIVLNGNPTLCEVESCIENLRKRLKSMGVTHIMLQPESDKYHQSGLLCDPH